MVAFRPETEIAAFSAFFETGARLGARHMLVAAYDPDLVRFADRFTAFCDAAAPYGLSADLEFMPWTFVPDLAAAKRIIMPMGTANAGILVDALHFDRSNCRTGDLADVPAPRLHYWQLCDAPAEHPATTEALMHAARCERMFPGEGGIDLVSLARAMPADITVSLEVPDAGAGEDGRCHRPRGVGAARRQARDRGGARWYLNEGRRTRVVSGWIGRARQTQPGVL